MSNPPSRRNSAVRFPTTCWSRVVAAGDPQAPGARDAMEGLCRDYWYPLYTFIRRRGHDRDAAADLVQGLFAELIARDDLGDLDPNRGRFRTFLLAACTHYLANRRDHDRAAKRGGGQSHIPLDALLAEGRYDHEPFHHMTPERLFERRWALTLLDKVLDRLGDEMAAAGKLTLFDRLHPTLKGGPDAPSYVSVAQELGMSEGAVKMAALRLRRRYREILHEEIGRTVADPEMIEDEIRGLFEALTC